ncbi:colorectal mutant cancer protein [Anguilla anguilla]|uniref:colorectal mutant cancer protein n=1 Tax=Anguilla anguilla TaxID=7936 RepID=UPI0015ACF9E2|nr:colorectal mutant cancer protein [Anguilla anguilla]
MDSAEWLGDQKEVLTEEKRAETCRVETPVPTGPSELEMAQCEAEMGTLLKVIAELNGRMNALQTTRDSVDSATLGQEESNIPTPGSLPNPSSQGIPEEMDLPTPSETSGTENEDSAQLWMELQGALAALEGSVIEGRTWAAPLTACNEEKHTQHLTAATESWVKATQVLEELEREFGISYPSELPAEEKQKYQHNVLSLHKHNCTLRATLQCRENELCRSKVTLNSLKEERNKLQLKLLSLQKHMHAGGSPSPPTSPSSSSSGAMSPCWASPPFPGSPLLLRRPTAAFPAFATGGDSTLPFSSSLGPPVSGSPSSSVSGGLETETDRLQRCIERLKARNERLSAALERRKGESEQISMTLSRHEANSTALQMALKYSEECEEAYNALLCLYDSRKQQGMPEPREATETVKESPLPRDLKPETTSPETGESLPTLSPPGGAKEAVEHQPSRGTPSTLEGQEKVIREKIMKLKQDRAAVCVPAREPDGERKPSPDTGTLLGSRSQETTRPHSIKREKAALLYELVTVREEMSELRGTIRLTEKERRCLDWTLTTQRAQDVAGALIAHCLREELEDRQTDRQRLAERGATLDSSRGIPGPRNRTLLRELQAALQREQVLKRRVTAVRESLDTALTDSATRRRYSEEERAQLVLAHSKAAETYRSARRKYREQLWRLERQVTAMSERHMTQITGLKATLEALEWKREETVL